MTDERYWDCECSRNYIHHKSDPDCPLCGAEHGTQPDSHKVELDGHEVDSVIEELPIFGPVAVALLKKLNLAREVEATKLAKVSRDLRLRQRSEILTAARHRQQVNESDVDGILKMRLQSGIRNPDTGNTYKKDLRKAKDLIKTYIHNNDKIIKALNLPQNALVVTVVEQIHSLRNQIQEAGSMQHTVIATEVCKVQALTAELILLIFSAALFR